MSLAHFRMINIWLLKRVPDAVPEEAPTIILDIISAVFMDKNGKDTNHIRHISRRMHFVRNFEECNLQKIVCCEGGMKLADIGTKNCRED